MNLELPKGWVEVEIGEIASVVGGGTPKASNPDNFLEPGKGTAWLTPADLSGYKQKEIGHGKRDLSEKGLNSSSAVLMPKGALLFSSRAPIGYVAIASNEISTNQGFKSFVFTEGVYPSYAFYYLKSIKSLAEERGSGSTFKELSGAAAKKLPFILPPTSEQIRIADKLDRVLARVNAAQSRLDKIPALIKRFRQSVLAAATSGELTREYREERHLESWGITTLGHLVSKIEAGKSIRCDERPPVGNEVGIVKISAVTWGRFQENESKTLKEKSLFIEERRIKVGDFLISRANTLELLGMPVIVNKIERNLMLSDKVLRLVMPEAEKAWVNIFLRSPAGRQQIESGSTGNQESMRNIGQKALLEIEIPHVSVEEKSEIVRRVESLFALAYSVEKQYQDAKARTDRMTQAILAKAFRGELVPQDPNDESAEQLLERIRQQCAEAAKTKPKSKSGRKTSTAKSKPEKITAMKLTEAPEHYLLTLLTELGGEADAALLWKKSGLEIDDFYALLKQESTIQDDNASADPSQRKLKIRQ